jgi:hypothetical protein
LNEDLARILIVLIAVVAANLPFVSSRMFGVIKLKAKTGWIRVFEILIGYGIAGGVGVMIESSLGIVHPQRWEFFALTFCLFLVFAFPGFVYRFLWRSPVVRA